MTAFHHVSLALVTPAIETLPVVRAKLANAPMPVPKGPSVRVRRRLVWGGLSSAGLLTAMLFFFDSFGLASTLCMLPGAQPGLSDACGRMGLGSRPKRAEREAWESRAATSCSALRDHIARFPNGIFRAQAADLLAGRRTSVSERGTPVTKPLSLFEARQGDAAKNQPRASSNTPASASWRRTRVPGFQSRHLVSLSLRQGGRRVLVLRQAGRGDYLRF